MVALLENMNKTVWNIVTRQIIICHLSSNQWLYQLHLRLHYDYDYDYDNTEYYSVTTGIIAA